MKRLSIGLFAAASVAAAAGCSQNAFQPIAVTRNASVVASCEKVADLSVAPGRFDNSDAALQLQREAREKGANTLLVASEDAKNGTAYRCAMPSATQTAPKSGSQ